MAKYRRYEEYKEAGVEWLDVIPNHWNTVSLKMLIDVRDGTHETPSYVEKTDSSYPLVTSKDVTSGQIDLTDCKHISQQDYESIIKRSAVFEGDILMPMIGTVGSPVLVEERLEIAIKNLALFRTSENNDKITAKFLHYFLNSKECSMQFSLEGRGGVQNFVSLGTLRSLGLPLISLEDQVQIANFLDFETAQIDTLIEKQQTLIQLLKEKRQAVISHAVTKGLNLDAPMKDSGVEWLGDVPEHWDITKVGWVLNYLSYGFTNPMPTSDEGPYMLTATDINFNEINFEQARTTTNDAYENFITSKSKPEQGDLLLTKDGTLGRVAVFNSTYKTCISQSIALLRPNKKYVLSYFMEAALASSKYQKKMIFDAGGTTIKHIYISILAKMNLALPDINEQLEITNYLNSEIDKFDALILKAQRAIQLMQERRTALISAAVTGKIDVRGWQAPDNKAS